MFVGGLMFGVAFVLLFNQLGRFSPAVTLGDTALSIAATSLVATLVESLPIVDIDNVTVTLAAVATSWLLIGPLGLWHAPFFS
jgi:hypothetical protein